MTTQSLDERAVELRRKLMQDAKAGGYNLNPDPEMVLELCRGLVTNQDRYGYPACPCRLAAGDKKQDLDIICPCDYRDPDLAAFGSCFCALYISDAVLNNEKPLASIPERRPPVEQRRQAAEIPDSSGIKVLRCRVCGYLCAREVPPDKCPICKAGSERFEEFNL